MQIKWRGAELSSRVKWLAEQSIVQIDLLWGLSPQVPILLGDALVHVEGTC